MHLPEYAGLDAVGLAELIRSKQVTAGEVEEAARRAVDAVNTDLNALTGPLFDPAPAADPAGPLAGVPFVVKDSGPVARGVPFTLGSRALRGAVAATDHAIMARFRAAGLVALAQSTTPELGLNFATESRRYGATRNPWHLGRGVGGSSGGSAALVAAGAVPLAHGNDGAGSLRVPAACCGVVGLKPSRGRVPGGEIGFGQVYEFGLTRTVRDCAALLDAVSGPIVGERYPIAPPARPYATAVDTDPGRLRIAVSTAAAVPVDRQVADTAVAVGQVLDWIGHDVREAAPAVEPDDVVEACVLTALSTGAAILRAPVRPNPDLLESVSRTVLQEAGAATLLDTVAGLDAQHRVIGAVASFFTTTDLLVTPTLAQLPPRHGTLDYDTEGHTVRSWLHRIFEFGPFTAAYNVSGNPAIGLPLGHSREGLPIGVQLVAAHGREDLLLSVASQLEQAVPWRDRIPPVFAG
ncbi:amidase [Rhodococcus sp. NPDC003318]|uniref:amidase n=1 Tax=Rhodococcus sp. NPDC003318 TaxID=3364503 RepID=UPI0036C2109B